MNDLNFLVCKSGYSVLYPYREQMELTENQMNVLSKNWGKVEYHGQLSAVTSRKIAHILEVWYRCLRLVADKKNTLFAKEKHQLVFITLTLSKPQLTNDNDVKRKMLNTFIIHLVKKYGAINYLWKAEKQKNGNIHFHIVTDVFIDKTELNHYWDSIQAQHNYIEKLMPFHKEYSSPSTRIEAILHRNGINSYMSKYVGKTDENGKVEGRCWGASNSVKKLKDIVFEIDSDVIEVCNQYANSEKSRINSGDFYVTFGQDLFFHIYMYSSYHRSKIHLWYNCIYMELYGSENVFNELDLKY